MTRTVIFLFVALLLGFSLLFARFKGHEKDFGGIGRYLSRSDNATAWAPYARYDYPSSEEFLRGFCRSTRSDSSFAKKLLPEDNFRHVLLSLRDSSLEYYGDPVDAYVKVVQQEMDIHLQGRIDGNSTLSDVLVATNELMAPYKLARQKDDSAFKARKEALDWERQRLESRAKDSVLYADQARAREMMELQQNYSSSPLPVDIEEGALPQER